jgi:hypothetical protein
LLQLLS